MMKRTICFLLALLIVVVLAACGGKTPQQTPDNPPSSGEPAAPVTPLPGKTDRKTMDLPTLPEENRNLPAGSNVVQVGDKWIVAPKLDTDVYHDTIYRQMSIYVLSREPMDVDSFTLTADREDSGLTCGVNENVDLGNVGWVLYFGYAGVDWKEVALWRDAQNDAARSGSFTLENADRWEDLEALDREYDAVDNQKPPTIYIYDLLFGFFDYQEEMAIHSLTLSWHGAEQTLDVGEIRLHPEYVFHLYGWLGDVGLDGDPQLGGSGGIFGPELNSAHLALTAEKEVNIQSVTCLNDRYQVVNVEIRNTAPGIDDEHTVSPEEPVTLYPGAEPDVVVCITGPHLSELTCMGDVYLLFDCEVDGEARQFVAEMNIGHWLDPRTMWAIVMDNVDMQGYYEYIYFDPGSMNGAEAEACEKLGWTERWEAMMAEN